MADKDVISLSLIIDGLDKAVENFGKLEESTSGFKDNLTTASEKTGFGKESFEGRKSSIVETMTGSREILDTLGKQYGELGIDKSIMSPLRNLMYGIKSSMQEMANLSTQKITTDNLARINTEMGLVGARVLQFKSIVSDLNSAFSGIDTGDIAKSKALIGSFRGIQDIVRTQYGVKGNKGLDAEAIASTSIKAAKSTVDSLKDQGLSDSSIKSIFRLAARSIPNAANISRNGFISDMNLYSGGVIRATDAAPEKLYREKLPRGYYDYIKKISGEEVKGKKSEDIIRYNNGNLVRYDSKTNGVVDANENIEYYNQQARLRNKGSSGGWLRVRRAAMDNPLLQKALVETGLGRWNTSKNGDSYSTQFEVADTVTRLQVAQLMGRLSKNVTPYVRGAAMYGRDLDNPDSKAERSIDSLSNKGATQYAEASRLLEPLLWTRKKGSKERIRLDPILSDVPIPQSQDVTFSSIGAPKIAPRPDQYQTAVYSVDDFIAKKSIDQLDARDMTDKRKGSGFIMKGESALTRMMGIREKGIRHNGTQDSIIYVRTAPEMLATNRAGKIDIDNDTQLAKIDEENLERFKDYVFADSTTIGGRDYVRRNINKNGDVQFVDAEAAKAIRGANLTAAIGRQISASGISLERARELFGYSGTDTYSVDPLMNYVDMSKKYKDVGKIIEATNRLDTPTVLASEYGINFGAKQAFNTGFLDDTVLAMYSGKDEKGQYIKKAIMDGATLMLPEITGGKAFQARAAGIKTGVSSFDYRAIIKDLYGLDNNTPFYMPRAGMSAASREIFEKDAAKGKDALGIQKLVEKNPELRKDVFDIMGVEGEDIKAIMSYGSAKSARSLFTNTENLKEQQLMFAVMLDQVGGLGLMESADSKQYNGDWIPGAAASRFGLSASDIKTQNEKARKKYIELMTSDEAVIKYLFNDDSDESKQVRKDHALLYTDQGIRTKVEEARSSFLENLTNGRSVYLPKRDIRRTEAKSHGYEGKAAIQAPGEVIAMAGKGLTVQKKDLEQQLDLDMTTDSSGQRRAKIYTNKAGANEEIAMFRFPFTMGEALIAKNQSDSFGEVIKKYGGDPTALYTSSEAMDIMGGGDWDVDTVNVIRGELVKSINEQNNRIKIAKDKAGKIQELTKSNVFGTSGEEEMSIDKEAFIQLAKNAAQATPLMATAYNTGEELTQIDMTDQENLNKYITGLIQSNDAYTTNSVYPKTGTYARVSKDMRNILRMQKPFAMGYKDLSGAYIANVIKKDPDAEVKPADLSRINFASMEDIGSVMSLMNMQDFALGSDVYKYLIDAQDEVQKVYSGESIGDVLRGKTTTGKVNSIELAQAKYLKKVAEIQGKQYTGLGAIISDSDVTQMEEALAEFNSVVAAYDRSDNVSYSDGSGQEIYTTAQKEDLARFLIQQNNKLHQLREKGTTQANATSGRFSSSKLLAENNARLSNGEGRLALDQAGKIITEDVKDYSTPITQEDVLKSIVGFSFAQQLNPEVVGLSNENNKIAERIAKAKSYNWSFNRLRPFSDLQQWKDKTTGTVNDRWLGTRYDALGKPLGFEESEDKSGSKWDTLLGSSAHSTLEAWSALREIFDRETKGADSRTQDDFDNWFKKSNISEITVGDDREGAGRGKKRKIELPKIGNRGTVGEFLSDIYGKRLEEYKIEKFLDTDERGKDDEFVKQYEEQKQRTRNFILTELTGQLLDYNFLGSEVGIRGILTGGKHGDLNAIGYADALLQNRKTKELGIADWKPKIAQLALKSRESMQDIPGTKQDLQTGFYAALINRILDNDSNYEDDGTLKSALTSSDGAKVDDALSIALREAGVTKGNKVGFSLIMAHNKGDETTGSRIKISNDIEGISKIAYDDAVASANAAVSYASIYDGRKETLDSIRRFESNLKRTATADDYDTFRDYMYLSQNKDVIDEISRSASERSSLQGIAAMASGMDASKQGEIFAARNFQMQEYGSKRKALESLRYDLQREQSKYENPDVKYNKWESMSRRLNGGFEADYSRLSTAGISSEYLQQFRNERDVAYNQFMDTLASASTSDIEKAGQYADNIVTGGTGSNAITSYIDQFSQLQKTIDSAKNAYTQLEAELSSQTAKSKNAIAEADKKITSETKSIQENQAVLDELKKKKDEGTLEKDELDHYDEKVKDIEEKIEQSKKNIDALETERLREASSIEANEKKYNPKIEEAKKAYESLSGEQRGKALESLYRDAQNGFMSEIYKYARGFSGQNIKFDESEIVANSAAIKYDQYINSIKSLKEKGYEEQANNMQGILNHVLSEAGVDITRDDIREQVSNMAKANYQKQQQEKSDRLHERELNFGGKYASQIEANRRYQKMLETGTFSDGTAMSISDKNRVYSLQDLNNRSAYRQEMNEYADSYYRLTGNKITREDYIERQKEQEKIRLEQDKMSAKDKLDSGLLTQIQYDREKSYLDKRNDALTDGTYEKILGRNYDITTSKSDMAYQRSMFQNALTVQNMYNETHGISMSKDQYIQSQTQQRLYDLQQIRNSMDEATVSRLGNVDLDSYRRTNRAYQLLDQEMQYIKGSDTDTSYRDRLERQYDMQEDIRHNGTMAQYSRAGMMARRQYYGNDFIGRIASNIAYNKEQQYMTENNVKNAEYKYNDAHAELEKMKSSGISESSEEYKNAASHVDNLKTELDAARASSVALAQAANPVNVVFNQLVNTVQRFAAQFGRRMFQKAIQEAKQFVQQFDASMNQIQMITQKTDAEMEQVKSNTIEKALSSKQSISNVSQAESILYRQGLSDNDMQNRLDTILQFSTVAGIKVESAAKIMTTAMQNGLVSSVQEAADAFTALGDNAATTAEEIAKAYQKVAATAKTGDISNSELMSLITFGTSNTQLSGQQIGTALNTIFTRMRKITVSNYAKDQNGEVSSLNDVETALGTAGIKLRENNDSFRSTYDILKDVGMIWDQLSDVQQSMITNAIAGTRGTNVFQTLMQSISEDGGAKLEEYLNLAENSSGITADKYAIAMESLSSAVTNLKNSFDSLIESLTSNGSLTGILDTFSQFFQNLSGQAGESAKAVSTWGVALGAIIPIIGKIIGLFVGGTAGGSIGSLLGTLAGAGAAALFGGISNSIAYNSPEAVAKRQAEIYQSNSDTAYNNVKKYQSARESLNSMNEALKKGKDSDEFKNAFKGLTDVAPDIASAFNTEAMGITDLSSAIETQQGEVNNLITAYDNLAKQEQNKANRLNAEAAEKEMEQNNETRSNEAIVEMFTSNPYGNEIINSALGTGIYFENTDSERAKSFITSMSYLADEKQFVPFMNSIMDTAKQAYKNGNNNMYSILNYGTGEGLAQAIKDGKIIDTDAIFTLMNLTLSEMGAGLFDDNGNFSLTSDIKGLYNWVLANSTNGAPSIDLGDNFRENETGFRFNSGYNLLPALTNIGEMSNANEKISEDEYDSYIQTNIIDKISEKGLVDKEIYGDGVKYIREKAAEKLKDILTYENYKAYLDGNNEESYGSYASRLSDNIVIELLNDKEVLKAAQEASAKTEEESPKEEYKGFDLITASNVAISKAQSASNANSNYYTAGTQLLELVSNYNKNSGDYYDNFSDYAKAITFNDENKYGQTKFQEMLNKYPILAEIANTGNESLLATAIEDKLGLVQNRNSIADYYLEELLNSSDMMAYLSQLTPETLAELTNVYGDNFASIVSDINAGKTSSEIRSGSSYKNIIDTQKINAAKNYFANNTNKDSIMTSMTNIEAGGTSSSSESMTALTSLRSSNLANIAYGKWLKGNISDMTEEEWKALESYTGQSNRDILKNMALSMTMTDKINSSESINYNATQKDTSKYKDLYEYYKSIGESNDLTNAFESAGVKYDEENNRYDYSAISTGVLTYEQQLAIDKESARASNVRNLAVQAGKSSEGKRRLSEADSRYKTLSYYSSDLAEKYRKRLEDRTPDTLGNTIEPFMEELLGSDWKTRMQNGEITQEEFNNALNEAGAEETYKELGANTYFDSLSNGTMTSAEAYNAYVLEKKKQGYERNFAGNTYKEDIISGLSTLDSLDAVSINDYINKAGTTIRSIGDFNTLYNKYINGIEMTSDEWEQLSEQTGLTTKELKSVALSSREQSRASDAYNDIIGKTAEELNNIYQTTTNEEYKKQLKDLGIVTEEGTITTESMKNAKTNQRTVSEINNDTRASLKENNKRSIFSKDLTISKNYEAAIASDEIYAALAPYKSLQTEYANKISNGTAITTQNTLIPLMNTVLGNNWTEILTADRLNGILKNNSSFNSAFSLLGADSIFEGFLQGKMSLEDTIQNLNNKMTEEYVMYNKYSSDVYDMYKGLTSNDSMSKTSSLLSLDNNRKLAQKANTALSLFDVRKDYTSISEFTGISESDLKTIYNKEGKEGLQKKIQEKIDSINEMLNGVIEAIFNTEGISTEGLDFSTIDISKYKDQIDEDIYSLLQQIVSVVGQVTSTSSEDYAQKIQDKIDEQIISLANSRMNQYLLEASNAFTRENYEKDNVHGISYETWRQNGISGYLQSKGVSVDAADSASYYAANLGSEEYRDYNAYTLSGEMLSSDIAATLHTELIKAFSKDGIDGVVDLIRNNTDPKNELYYREMMNKDENLRTAYEYGSSDNESLKDQAEIKFKKYIASTNSKNLDFATYGTDFNGVYTDVGGKLISTNADERQSASSSIQSSERTLTHDMYILDKISKGEYKDLKTSKKSRFGIDEQARAAELFGDGDWNTFKKKYNINSETYKKFANQKILSEAGRLESLFDSTIMNPANTMFQSGNMSVNSSFEGKNFSLYDMANGAIDFGENTGEYQEVLNEFINTIGEDLAKQLMFGMSDVNGSPYLTALDKNGMSYGTDYHGEHGIMFASEEEKQLALESGEYISDETLLNNSLATVNDYTEKYGTKNEDGSYSALTDEQFNALTPEQQEEYSDAASLLMELGEKYDMLSESGKEAANELKKTVSAANEASNANEDLSESTENASESVEEYNDTVEDQTEISNEVSESIGISKEITDVESDNLQEQVNSVLDEQETEFETETSATVTERVSLNKTVDMSGVDMGNPAAQAVIDDMVKQAQEAGKTNISYGFTKVISDLGGSISGFITNLVAGQLSTGGKTNPTTGGNGKSKGGGGGGGGKGKSAATKLLNKIKRVKSTYEHNTKMNEILASNYQEAGDLQSYGTMLEERGDLYTTRQQDLVSQMRQIEDLMNSKKVKYGSDDWYSLLDALREAEEEYNELTGEIKKNTDEIEENKDAIRSTKIEVEDALRKAYEDAEDLRKTELEGTVSMQNEILDAIKERYQKEWDLIKEDIEKKKKALQEEMSLIDERLNKRKNANDLESKYKELSELQYQLSMISADSSRTKEQKELQKKIDDLTNEIADKNAENEAAYQKDLLQQQSDAYDEFADESQDDFDGLLENANNFSDEVTSILESSYEDMVSWLEQNNKDFSNSLQATQQKMLEEWESTFDQMNGYTETYNDLISNILASSDSKEEFMNTMRENSAEYRVASDTGKKSLEYEWEQKWKDYENGYADTSLENRQHTNSLESADNDDETWRTTRQAYLFSKENKKSTKLAKIPGGTTLTVLGGTSELNDWLKVQYGNAIGYILKDKNVERILHATEDYSNYKAYSTGGIVDYTGMAAVHGTALRPEAFLNADDTKVMREFLETAKILKYQPSISNIGNESFEGNTTTTIGDINVTIEADINTDDDYSVIAQRVGEELMKSLSQSGINMARYSW